MIQDRGCGDPVERGSISIGIEFVCACSVGLRRSEIDGYFERSHLCPRDVARLCGNQFIWNSDRKFIQNTGSHSCTIPITAVGCLFGRATSLGDRRLRFRGVVAGTQWKGPLFRSESNLFGACSVGLRRSEIDGYFGYVAWRSTTTLAASLGDRRLLWLRRLEIDGYFLPPSDFLGLLVLLSLLLVLLSALLPLSDDVSDF